MSIAQRGIGDPIATIARPTHSIGVLVVEDHTMVGQMMASVLEGEPDITVLGRVATAAEAVTFADGAAVDVVLMDFRLPDGDGITAARTIRESHPGTRVIIVTGETSDHLLSDALRAGCSGYINKSEGVDTLASAVRGAHAGVTAISPETMARAMASVERRKAGAADGDQLTDRELDVLRLLAEGMANREIAARLFISPLTVRNHAQNLMEKLDAHSKLEAVTAAIRMGLVDAPR